MSHIQANRVQETTTTTGTGDVALAGAVTGFQTFAAVMANNDTCLYCIAQQSAAEWEVGIGTFVSATPALARTTVLASSNGGALVNFSAGTKDVFITLVASRLFLPYLAATPGVPASGLWLYAKDRLGIPMPYMLGPTGFERTLAQDSVLVVRNQTGASIPIFTPVYASGTGAGGEPLVAPAEADVDASMPAIGVTVAAIANGANGLIIRSGILTDLNTSGFSVNDTIYVGITAGAFTTTAPTFPAKVQKIGRILSSHASEGVALIYNFPVQQGDVVGGVALSPLASDPVAPATGAYLYARALAGRTVPRFIGPSGLDSAVQPSLWANSVVMWLPGTGTTVALNFGVSWTVSATQAHPTIADTNIMTAIRRATFTTTTTAGNATGPRTTAQVAIRNRGFFFAARWGILTYTATMQAWCGLGAAVGNIGGDPSAANNSCGMSKDTAETTWQIFTRDATATSKLSTGRATAAAGNAEVFDIFMFCKPNDTQITFRVIDVATGQVVLADSSRTANLPDDATALYAHCECRNQAGGAGSAVAIFLAKLYIEMDI